MFNGIVQGTAKLSSIIIKKKCRTYTFIFPNNIIKNLSLGSSISSNGCCLSVVKINKNYISFDVINETFNKTNFKNLKMGDYINIEKPLTLQDGISGHLISGHVICTAKIINIKNNLNNFKLYLKLNDIYFMKYIFIKNFISIDGVSLTISELRSNSFCVFLIPDTLKRTIFLHKKINDIVNIEIDNNVQIVVDTTEKFIKNYISNIIK
ncbi:riboflavin synthase subunit alpha [Candidatus Purcelliella pentastirinorum]|uniref:Riboflavin synthase n=1 Tax=Candidatus Purcelliella pentastirinorum TaxID=472834 RepID=A0AAX3N9N4_9ENTR|nr:riboflavin synthase subunit alpha [Candidatus Purcelliella pentastirinorum]WDI78704.1 riboflavin synthase subunit alpha [Candidatus Purcelliella pentastirinorum]WDR80684.1 riboflavin synthase subunit alpha [Candidatus Purcelliella pentastirinorum]